MITVKSIVKKCVYGHRADSKSLIKYLRKKGAKIGERTTFYDTVHSFIDETRPWLLSIGNDVQIPCGVTILTHGYDWSVLKGVYGDVLGSSGGYQSETMFSSGQTQLFLREYI